MEKRIGSRAARVFALRPALALLLGLAAALPCLAVAADPGARAAFNDAVALYKAGQLGKAQAAFEALASGGDPRGEFALAVMHEHGQGVPRDLEQAKAHYRRAAERGYVKAQLNLGLLLEAESAGRAELVAEAAHWFTAAAALGQRDALLRLEGLAKRGVPAARAGLGRLHLTGSGVAKDPGMALGMLESAAHAGVRDAAYNLGVMHEVGIGVERDARSAAIWYREAARAADVTAGYNLGLLLARAPELTEEFGSPEPWLAEAAARGDARAAHALALWLEQRPLSMVDATRVLSLYELAARAGKPAAQVNLAYLLAHPDSDDAQLELAYAWTLLAVEAGSNVAEANLRRLDALLAVSARERARERARELLDAPPDFVPATTDGLAGRLAD